MKRLTVALLLAVSILTTGCAVANPHEDKELSYREAGIAAIEKGDYDGAVTNLQKSLDASNGRISDVELDVCYYKGYALLKAGKTDEAKKVYNAIINYDEEATGAYVQRGNLYALTKQYAKADKDYKKALELDQNNFQIYISAYENLMAGGAEEELAKSYLNQALTRRAQTGEEYRNMGRVYLLLGDYENARKIFSKAENEGDEESKLYMGQVLESMGNKEEAYALYESYAMAHKDNKKAFMKLIESLLKQKDYEQVKQYIKKAKNSLKGDDKKEIMELEIKLCEEEGELSEAMNLLKTYTAKYPSDEKAAKELKFLQSRVK
ncbi:MAG: tetratricopeptide repeat protein [Lachnospiraceae bacterium]|nr:tetratricopeptide repeat protein [Lachnospiraceae bacterium]